MALLRLVVWTVFNSHIRCLFKSPKLIIYYFSFVPIITVCCCFVLYTQAELTKQQNDFKIKLKELEDSLLSRLSSAGGNFLGDTALVENLETTKRTAAEIEQKV